MHDVVRACQLGRLPVPAQPGRTTRHIDEVGRGEVAEAEATEPRQRLLGARRRVLKAPSRRRASPSTPQDQYM